MVDPKHAIAPEAAVATDQAALEIIRLTRSNKYSPSNNAAVLIQTAFRGYLVTQSYLTI